nr:hypothetical protein [Tanacetum cinerariifolium]
MALPDKHQLKFNTHKDDKTLMEAIEKRFGGNTETKKVQKTLLKQQYKNFIGSSYESLDQIHDRLQKLISQLEILKVSLSQKDINLNLKIYEAKVKSSSSASTSTQNIAFLSSSNTDSTTEPVSAAASVFVVSAKIHVSALPNVDSLSNAVIYLFFANQSNRPQLDNDDLKQIDADDLVEMDLKWQMAMLTVRADDLFKRQKGILKQMDLLPWGLICPRWSVTTATGNDTLQGSVEEEPTNYALMAFSSLSSSSDNEVVSWSKACTKAYATLQSHYDNLTEDYGKSQFDVISYQMRLESVELSPTKPNQDLSYTHRPSTPIIEDWVSNSEDESKTKTPQNVSSFVQPTKQVKSPRPSVLHVETSILTANFKIAIPKPTRIGKRKNKKACFVCKSLDHLMKDCDYHEKTMAQTPARNHAKWGNHKQYAQMTLPNPQRHVVPTAVLTQSKLVPITTIRPITTVGYPQHALKDKGVIDSGCSRHMTGNMSYLYDFEELNGGYVAFGGNPKNMVLVTKPHNKTPYELLHGKTPSIGFMRPFGCLVTILNTLDSLGKFDGKVDEGFLVGYSVSSKSFRVLNSQTRIVQETLHVYFLENKPNVAGSGSTWLFDIDTLTKTMNYQPVTTDNQSNPSAGVQEQFDAEKPREENAAFDEKEPGSKVNVSPSNSAQSQKHDDKNKREAKGKSHDNAAGTLVPIVGQLSPNSTNTFSAAELEDITYSDDEDDVRVEADFNNLETSIIVSPIPIIRVHKDHHVTQIIGDLSSATQTRSMTRVAKDQGRLSQINNDDFHTCMFACFLSQEETKRVHQALKDLSWIKAMQEELLQFKMQKVWVLVDLPYGKRDIANVSFMGFMVYQMDVKSAFLYETIKEEVYVYQPLGFEDPDYPDKVFKVVKALYGLHQAPRAWYETLANYLLENGFQRGKIDQTLFFKRQKDGKLASIPIDNEKPLLKDPDVEDVNVHTYRSMIGSLISMIGSLMYLTCACALFQVTPKASYLHAVKRIFRYLKGKPHLGLWYPKDSPLDLASYSDSDYAGASLNRKSTTRGCQFLGFRLISWQCKKQTVVATSSTEAEYVAAASCCAQVLWIHN